MGIINGGPFGAMKNKTGNLVFRKVKRKNVVTIHVPNPRDPKTVTQLYFRSIIQRIGYEMATGLANAASALMRDKHDVNQPENLMVKKTALKYNKADLPAVMFPQFEQGRLSKELPSIYLYNPFFDCLSFPLLSNNVISSGKLPLLLLMIYNRFSEKWVVLPDCVCLADGFQGNCFEGGQIGADTYEVVTYANYSYFGIGFWLEIAIDSGVVNGNNYNNDINPNFMPGTLKLSTDWQNLPVIVATEENLKELRNFVPGFGYTKKMRKGTIFTPTMLNKLAGKTIEHSQPIQFTTAIFEDIPFNEFLKIETPINVNNFYANWEINITVNFPDIDFDAVEALLGTSNVLYRMWFLFVSGEHDYMLDIKEFDRTISPTNFILYNSESVYPVSIMMVYKNVDTGQQHLDFIKHWFNPDQDKPISQLETWYNLPPQRFYTPGGNPGMWLTLYKNVDGDISRAAEFSVELFFAGTAETIVLQTDYNGNCIHEFDGEEMEIVGLGYDKSRIIKIKTGYNLEYLETEVNILVSGKCFSSFGVITQSLIP